MRFPNQTLAYDSVSCVLCGVAFTPNSGSHKFCSVRCRKKATRPDTNAQYQRISGNWPKYFQRLTCHRERKGITTEECIQLLEEQRGRCALSGEVLECRLQKGVVNPYNASLDRIQAGGAYTKGNVQLVCVAINKFRGNLTSEDFVNWCKKVTEHAIQG